MKREAEEFAESDKLEKEKVEKLNSADSMIFQTEKQIKEFEEKITEEDKSLLNECLTSLKKSHSEANLEEIETDMSKLNETWQKISERLYSEVNSDKPSEDQTDTEVEDTQFEEVK
jgi:molecular chaperone DnaK